MRRKLPVWFTTVYKIKPFIMAGRINTFKANGLALFVPSTSFPPGLLETPSFRRLRDAPRKQTRSADAPRAVRRPPARSPAAAGGAPPLGPWKQPAIVVSPGGHYVTARLQQLTLGQII